MWEECGLLRTKAIISASQESPNQCLILINADQCWSTPVNADQCWSMPINTNHMSINADQNYGIDPTYLSIKINQNQIRIHGIDRHWSLFTGVGINSTIRISIEWYWSAMGIDRWSPVLQHYILRFDGICFAFFFFVSVFLHYLDKIYVEWADKEGLHAAQNIIFLNAPKEAGLLLTQLKWKIATKAHVGWTSSCPKENHAPNWSMDYIWSMDFLTRKSGWSEPWYTNY